MGRKRGRKQKQQQQEEDVVVEQLPGRATVAHHKDWTVIVIPKAKKDLDSRDSAVQDLVSDRDSGQDLDSRDSAVQDLVSDRDSGQDLDSRNSAVQDLDSDRDSGQETANPEAMWFPYIDDNYPHLLTQTYFYPPFHFNRIPYTITNIAKLRIHLQGNPSLSPPPSTEYAHVPDIEQQNNRAWERCLSALSSIPNQVMMVVSRLILLSYLNGYDPPCHQLPTLYDPSFLRPLTGGHFDILLIHRHYGFLVGEVKSVGASSSFHEMSPLEQTWTIKEELAHSVTKLQSRKVAVRFLVSDVAPVRITKIAMFPFITSSQLRSAFHCNPNILVSLCDVLGVDDVNEAMRHCLCEEDVAEPSLWWQRLYSAGPDPTMTEGIFKRLVARFCGPASCIEVPTIGTQAKMLRCLGDAVAEAGWQFRLLSLTLSQVDLMTKKPEPRYVYMQGPPGTGKAICLFIKAVQWAQQGRRVVCVSASRGSRSHTLVLKDTILKKVKVGEDAIQLADLDLQGDMGAAVAALQQRMGRRSFSVIVVAVDCARDRFLQWLTKVRARLPGVTVWAAGVYRMDRGLAGQPLPTWLEVHTWQEALRISPSVAAHLQRLNELQGKDIPPYVASPYPVVTQGLPVQQLQHRGQPGHSGDHPWQCEACGELLFDILHNQLRLGQSGHSLNYKDAIIVYGGGDAVPRSDDVMVRHLQRRGLPTRAVTSYPLGDEEVKELALAVKDVITVVSWRSVQALDRRVVIALNSQRLEGSDFSLSTTCVSSSALYCID